MASIDGISYDFSIDDDRDDLSTSLGTETLAARDMIPDEFKAASAPGEQSIGGKRFLVVEQSANQRTGSKVFKVWNYGK
jgi:hypothetical protein